MQRAVGLVGGYAVLSAVKGEARAVYAVGKAPDGRAQIISVGAVALKTVIAEEDVVNAVQTRRDGERHERRPKRGHGQSQFPRAESDELYLSAVVQSAEGFYF